MIRIAACLKWVEHRIDVDPITGDVSPAPGSSGASEADLAALEWALRMGEAWGAEVVAVTSGPEAAEVVLRTALSAGASRAVRVDLPCDVQSDVVAAGLAEALADVDVVLCGDWSLDRGSGSVPAFLAAELDAAQALGLVALTVDAATPNRVGAERRLDAGRRERLAVRAPMVLSVEGATARLRRASLSGVLAAKTRAVEVVRPARRASRAPLPAPIAVGPFRPRPRTLPPPDPSLDARHRILALTGALVERTPPQLLELDPEEAAERLVEQLRAWGYLS